MTKIRTKVDRLVDSLSKASINREIDEFLLIGYEKYMSHAQVYLNKHTSQGTREARSYFLIAKGEELPMKTIGRMAQARLGFDVYNTNSITFATVFRRLGYQVKHTYENLGVENFPFVIGKKYSRQQEIHEVFGGQERGGISTPADCSYIFIFTGKSGEEYGYQDGWQNEDVFLYTGEGQVGDMQMKVGNKAIAEHLDDGKELLLFKIMGKGRPVKFMGKFICQSWDEQVGPDRAGNDRKTIRFHLMKETWSSSRPDEEPDEELSNETLDQLRKKAIAASKTDKKKSWRDASKEYRKRSNIVKAYVLKRANGVCELSGEPAPFQRKNGTPYLEVHHTKRIADDGPDHPRWVAAINPTLHREIHSGENGNKLNRELIEQIEKKEKTFER